jgi:hypothetical protein
MPTSPRSRPEIVNNAPTKTTKVSVLGVSVPVPPPDRAVLYGGIAALALIELIEWPLALAIVAADQVVRRNKGLIERIAGVVSPR